MQNSQPKQFTPSSPSFSPPATARTRPAVGPSDPIPSRNWRRRESPRTSRQPGRLRQPSHRKTIPHRPPPQAKMTRAGWEMTHRKHAHARPSFNSSHTERIEKTSLSGILKPGRSTRVAGRPHQPRARLGLPAKPVPTYPLRGDCRAPILASGAGPAEIQRTATGPPVAARWDDSDGGTPQHSARRGCCARGPVTVRGLGGDDSALRLFAGRSGGTNPRVGRPILAPVVFATALISFCLLAAGRSGWAHVRIAI